MDHQFKALLVHFETNKTLKIITFTSFLYNFLRQL